MTEPQIMWRTREEKFPGNPDRSPPYRVRQNNANPDALVIDASKTSRGDPKHHSWPVVDVVFHASVPEAERQRMARAVADLLALRWGATP